MKTVEQLSDVAWKLLEEALTTGAITLTVGDKAESRIISTEALIDLAAKLSVVKIKKPSVVTTPEDFELQETTGED